MVCCILLSMIIGSALWLIYRVVPIGGSLTREPLAWRLATAEHSFERNLESAKPGRFTVAARCKSIIDAGRGLQVLLKGQHNAWIHFGATLSIIAAGIAVNMTLADWRWIAIAIAWVWSAEAFNTSLEVLCDVVSPDWNAAVRIAKDVAAGGVLIAALGATVLGAVTFAPYLTGAQAEGPASVCSSTTGNDSP